MLNWQISNLEKEAWIPKSDPSINPIPPKEFVITKLASSLQIMCYGDQYCGALAKNDSPLIYPSTEINFSYSVFFSEDIVNAQVIETDMKLTDKDGWTYDGSFQFNVANGWMTQINNPWVDTGVKKPLTMDVYNPVTINYKLDYVNRTIRINDSAPIIAKQVGWAKSTITTQLQLCTNKLGMYTLKFQNIGFKG